MNDLSVGGLTARRFYHPSLAIMLVYFACSIALAIVWMLRVTHSVVLSGNVEVRAVRWFAQIILIAE